MTSLKLLAIGTALFGLGITGQQMALNWMLFHSSTSSLSTSDQWSKRVKEIGVELKEHRETLKAEEAEEALKEIETAFKEKNIRTQAKESKGAAGALKGQRWRQRIAPFGMVLKVAGSFFWLLSILKLFGPTIPRLQDQVCATGAAGMLVWMVMFDQSAYSVVSSAMDRTGVENPFKRGGARDALDALSR